MEKDEYWLWLGTIPGIGNVTALKLLNAFGGDIRVLYEADKKTIAGRHIVSEKQLQSIIYSRNRDRICRAYADEGERAFSAFPLWIHIILIC
ncbi:MAG: helix-hairpin-helix domain-containing protein [Coprococcus sp.]